MSTLIGMFRCYGSYLLYNITFEDRTVLLTANSEVVNALVAEWFEEGTRLPYIRVCRYQRRNVKLCDSNSYPLEVDLGNVQFVVGPNTAMLFPYDNLAGDSSFRGVVDGTAEINPPKSIPFFQGYYRNLYVRNSRAAITAHIAELLC